MVSSLTEKSLEALIIAQMTAPLGEGGGWVEGSAQDYDRAHAVDLVQLTEFIRTTRPDLVEALALETIRRRGGSS